MVPVIGTRTPDPIITNDVLYQLSYTGLGSLRSEPGRRNILTVLRFGKDVSFRLLLIFYGSAGR